MGVLMTTKQRNQGASANHNGKWFEDNIRRTIEQRGYVYLPNKQRDIANPFFQEQVKRGLLSIYGKELKHDFYLYHPTKFPKGCVIESKYQSVGGSVDEKFPFTALTLKGLDIPTILIIDGGGATPASIDWCEAQQTHDFTVFRGWSAFNTASNRGFL